MPAILFLAACGGVIGSKPPPEEDMGTAGSRPIELSPQDDEEAQKILEDYARRFKEGYPLYPGDQIRFSVLGNADLSFTARVPTEGYITYPLIGKVVLTGRTTQEVREELAKRLGQDYLVNPDVTILVEEYSKKKIYVLGSVTKPQDYELPNGQMITLLQSIALAGGFTEDAEKHQVMVFRARSVGGFDRITLPVNVVSLTTTGKGKDPLVIPDDIVFVPAREKVFVLGQVNKPGAYTITADQPTTVTQAIAMAGGLTRISQEGAVRLIRKQKDGPPKTYIVNVGRVLAGHAEDDVRLQPGDTIFVPESFF